MVKRRKKCWKEFLSIIRRSLKKADVCIFSRHCGNWGKLRLGKYCTWQKYCEEWKVEEFLIHGAKHCFLIFKEWWKFLINKKICWSTQIRRIFIFNEHIVMFVPYKYSSIKLHVTFIIQIYDLPLSSFSSSTCYTHFTFLVNAKRVGDEKGKNFCITHTHTCWCFFLL